MGFRDAGGGRSELQEAVRYAPLLKMWESNLQDLAITARALSTLAAEDSELPRSTSSAAIDKA